MPGMGFDMMQQPVPSAAPFQMLPPEILAQIAARSFRPPQGGGPQGGAPGLPGFNSPNGDGGMGAGAMGLGAALGAMNKNSNPAQKPAGMPAPNQYGIVDPEATQSAYPGDPAKMPGQTGGDGGFFKRLLGAVQGLF